LGRVGAGVLVGPGADVVVVLRGAGVGVAPLGVSSEQAINNTAAGTTRRSRFFRDVSMCSPVGFELTSG
jgi:hypothetical protein